MSHERAPTEARDGWTPLPEREEGEEEEEKTEAELRMHSARFRLHDDKR